MNTPYDKMAARSPYDECVDWVSEQFRIVSEKLLRNVWDLLTDWQLV